ncbi:hypothetical protein ACNOYE_24855 [Nannocystaceae bacterium ST9]
MSEPANDTAAPTQSTALASVGAAPHVIATRTEPQAIVPLAHEHAELEHAELEPVQRKPAELLRTYASEPTPAPAYELHAASFLWGLAQPLLGLRMLWRHQDLLTRAILPVLGFVGVCLVVAEGGSGVFSWIGAYYLTLIAAAPLSPILFCRNYARLAALARPHFGLEPREPYLRSFRQTLVEAFVQLLVVGLGVAPLAGLVAAFPLIGPVWAAVLGYLWALHWVVVEALDSAKTLPPGASEPPPTDHLDRPWFAAPASWHLRGWAATLFAPLRWWTRMLGRLGAHWRGEVEIVERRPWIASGFALGSALLLAIPVLNLLFRPAVVVAAAHVLGRLEDE